MEERSRLDEDEMGRVVSWRTGYSDVRFREKDLLSLQIRAVYGPIRLLITRNRAPFAVHRKFSVGF